MMIFHLWVETNASCGFPKADSTYDIVPPPSFNARTACAIDQHGANRLHFEGAHCQTQTGFVATAPAGRPSCLQTWTARSKPNRLDRKRVFFSLLFVFLQLRKSRF